MSNPIVPGSSADVNVQVRALGTDPNVSVQYKTVILKKNLVNGVNTLTQAMINQTNTKYVIKYDYTLGENVTIPANCVLEFDGGKIINSTGNSYSLTGSNTCIKADNVAIFKNMFFLGTWNIPFITSLWLEDASEKDTIKQLINLTDDNISNTVVIENGEYEVSVPENTHSIYGNAALDLKSNTNLIINGNICLVDSPYRATSIIRVENKKNVIIDGCGSLIGNTDDAPSASEWEFGFGVYIIGIGVIVKNIEITKCTGDAIIVGTEIQEGFIHSKNVTVSNLSISNCYRQGISVIDGDNIFISNNTINNVGGVPGAGRAIDIELSYSWQQIKNVIISNNISANCAGIYSYDMNYAQREDNFPIKNLVVMNNDVSDGNIDIRYVEETLIKNNRAQTVVIGAKIGTVDNNLVINSVSVSEDPSATGIVTATCDLITIKNNIITAPCFITADNDLLIENNTINCNKLFRDTNNRYYRMKFKGNTISCDEFKLPHYYCLFDKNHISFNALEIGNFVYNNDTLISCDSYNEFTNNYFNPSGNSKFFNVGNYTTLLNNTFSSQRANFIKVYTGSYIQHNRLIGIVLYIESLIDSSLGETEAFANVTIRDNLFISGGDRFINVNANNVCIDNNIFDARNYSPFGVYIEKLDAKGVTISNNICRGASFGLIVNSANGNHSALKLLYNIKQDNTTTYYKDVFVPYSTIELNHPKGGTTRPTNITNNIPISFFDKSNGINKPIWWDGTQWVDATGSAI